MHFSSLKNIQLSPTVGLNSLVIQKQSRGERIFNLSVGEPMLPTPPAIIAAAETAMREMIDTIVEESKPIDDAVSFAIEKINQTF